MQTLGIINQTKKWVKEVVIACNFCPFAAAVVNQKKVNYVVEESEKLDVALEAFLLECNRMDLDDDIETTLLIYPNSFVDFEDYLDFLNLAEQIIESNAYDGTYQVASFHPLYQFADSAIDDAANFTNRSPYPMLHILREASVEDALAKYPHAEEIPERNIAFAREKGLSYMQMLRDACLRI